VNCHRARTAIVEQEFGELTLGFEHALDEHLSCCDACREHAALERLLVADLGALREADPPHVDVRVRVMDRIAELPPVDTLAVSQRQLAWAATAAVAAAVVVVTGLRSQSAALADAGGTAVDGTRAILSATGSIFAALKSLLLLPWRLLGSLWEGFAPALDMAGRLEPVAVAAISLGLISMMLTIGWVVGNDLRRPWRKRE
jgi:hypothetical protein